MLSDLNPTNNIYVEYSNEVWNWQFRQATDNLHAANYSVLHDGDPHHLNYDNSNNPGYWAWRRTAYQIKHVADLFKTVFGDDNVGPWKRVRPILSGQVSYPFVIETGLELSRCCFWSTRELSPWHGWSTLLQFRTIRYMDQSDH